MGVKENLRQVQTKPVTTDCGGVLVRRLSGRHAAILNKRADASGEVTGIESLYFIVAACLCDEDGARLYDATNKNDLEEVSDFEVSTLKQIMEAALEFSGLGETGEAAVKNGSTRTPPSSSGADSRSSSESPTSSDFSDEPDPTTSPCGSSITGATPSEANGSRPPN